MADLTQWTLNRLVTKIQNDLELHAENFVTKDEIIQFINDAIDDAEETIVDQFSDFWLTFEDSSVQEGKRLIPLPADLYDLRIRGIYYDKNGFDPSQANVSGEWYKIRKLKMEQFATVISNDYYSYRITNSKDGAVINILPAFQETSTGNVRIWYVRQAVRLEDDSDILERGIKPQYVISHAKVAIMEKEGDPALDVEIARLNAQETKMISALSRLTDDNEDSYLNPDNTALEESYGNSYGSGSWT